MCGRFERMTPIKVLATLFDCPEAPHETPTHYNIAPTQPVAVVRVIRAAPGGQREMTVMRWGLIPSWADDPSIGNRLINARSETAAEKPSFRAALKQRRCLVPVDGFYEWQAAAKGKTKQPFLIRLKSGQPFALAGLWERWTSPDGELVESFTVLTTDANDVGPRPYACHHRSRRLRPLAGHGHGAGGRQGDASAVSSGSNGTLPGEHPGKQSKE
jgi:putative SOS response-associated peptidase YedK